MVHTQQRAVGSPATATTDLVSMTTTQGVRAVTSVTASAVVTTNLTPVQTPTRSLVTQVSQGKGAWCFSEPISTIRTSACNYSPEELRKQRFDKPPSLQPQGFSYLEKPSPLLLISSFLGSSSNSSSSSSSNSRLPRCKFHSSRARPNLLHRSKL